MPKPKISQRSPNSNMIPLGSRTSQTTQNQIRPCVFCGGHHYNAECDKYPTSKERDTIAKEKILCRRCLKKGHWVSDCYVKKVCFHCKDSNHHTALCHGLHRREKTQSSTAGAITVSGAATTPSYKPVAMLMSAEIELYNPTNPKIRTKTVAFIDTGSQRSFITTELANRLKLRASKYDELKLQGLQGTALGTRSSALTEVGIRHDSFPNASRSINVILFCSEWSQYQSPTPTTKS